MIRRKLKFEDYENWLAATQIENTINQLEKNKPNVNSLRIRKNNRLILKSQQRFKSKKHNVFTEAVNKIALSANNDKK